MSRMHDYVKWRGDLRLEQAALNEIDLLIFTQLSYLHFGEVLPAGSRQPLSAIALMLERIAREAGNAAIVQERHELLRACAASKRFGSVLVSDSDDIFDPARDMQFAATLFSLPNGSRVLAFRGTDATIVGWREDFNMSFECPVPAQAEAVRYTQRLAEQYNGRLLLCGHSKGGNLAVYAGACCTDAVRQRIDAVYTFDGPGLDEKTLQTEGYQAILPRIYSCVPQTSVIGMLMGITEKYTVVRSSSVAIWQHNTFTWELDGPRFVTLPQTDAASRMIRSTLDSWLRQSTPETRRVLVETLFQVLQSTNARTFKDMSWSTTAAALWNTTSNLEPSTRKVVTSIIGSLLASGVGEAKERLKPGDAADKHK